MPKSKETNVFETLYQVDVKPFLVKKGRYDYLPWATAIRLLMEHYPDAIWCNRSHEREIRLDTGIVKTAFPYFYDPVIGGLAVETEVNINGLVKWETLPVIDYKNNIVKNPDWMAINTAQKRCLVKNISLFGLGLKVYEGIHNCEEDYTYGESTSNNAPPVAPSKAEKEKKDIIETAKEVFGGAEISSHETVSGLLTKRFPKNAKNRITLLKSIIADKDQYRASQIVKVADLTEEECQTAIQSLNQ